MKTQGNYSKLLDTTSEEINPATEEKQDDTITKLGAGITISSIDYETDKSGIDRATETLQTIEYEHHEVHSGSHYFVTGVETLPINDVLDFTFQTPATTKWTHLTWKISTSAEMAWYIYENVAVVNALANAITPRNNDRNSTNTSGNILKYEVQADLTAANVDTNVTGATLIESGICGAGKDNGDINRNEELVLKQNTIYCMRAVATAAGYINFHMGWYEHTNKN